MSMGGFAARKALNVVSHVEQGRDYNRTVTVVYLRPPYTRQY